MGVVVLIGSLVTFLLLTGGNGKGGRPSATDDLISQREAQQSTETSEIK